MFSTNKIKIKKKKKLPNFCPIGNETLEMHIP